uniref:G-protein coupled receptors family 1 profile domain-containing protein n=1 Tax=Erpetoichthys calabaricus TaxID=27687 RepID=A0A8C4RJQ6_ERPCA
MMTAKSEFLNSGVGYCYPDNNASCIKIMRSAGVSALLYILSGTLVVVAIFGNLFVIIAVSHFRQLHTPTNFFVLSLAVADFLSGVLIMPVEFAAVIDYCWYLDDAVCPYHIMYGYFLLFVSVLNLIMDRYLAVCDPFFYNRNVTNLRTGMCIAFMWLLASLYTYMFIFKSGGLLVTDMCVGGCFFFHYTNWWIINNLLTYLLPMLVIIFRLFFSISIVSILSVQTVLIFLVAINCCIDPIIYGLFYPWFRKSLKMMVTLKIFKSSSSMTNLFSV